MARTLIGNIKGPKGDTGETGATGATGAAGASASVSVGTVTALEYGNNPTVTNSGSAQNAVFNFGIPKGKPADNITELDNLPVNSSVTPSDDFPVPAVGDTSKTILGKIIKWFGDMSALVATKFNAANVYNGLDKTESGYALDARQGKALNDTKLNVANVVNNLTTTDSGYALDARQGKALYDILSPYIKVVATAQVTTETVWSNVQKAALVAPTVNGYKFLCWICVETIGSVAVGYVASPYQANTNAFYPQQTANFNVAGTALYIRNI